MQKKLLFLLKEEMKITTTKVKQKNTKDTKQKEIESWKTWETKKTEACMNSTLISDFYSSNITHLRDFKIPISKCIIAIAYIHLAFYHEWYR